MSFVIFCTGNNEECEKTMSLKYAILGFLDMMPLSGYDLKKMFDSSVKFYWSATHTQIYRTLNEIHKDELVEVELIHQTDSPNKKVYSITEKGKEDLHKWVSTPSDLPPVRHKLLVQLSWADRLSTEEIVELLQKYLVNLEERIAIYKSNEHHNLISLGRTKREQILWNSTLQNGIATYEAELKWAQETIDAIENNDK